MMRHPLGLAILGLLLATLAAPARADAPSTTIDLGISNAMLDPSAVYGPWQSATISIRSIAGADKPGLSITTRRDADAGAPTSGTSLTIDDYHQFSPRAYAYASLQTASGTIFPTRDAYLEVDSALREGLAFGVGGGISVDASGLVQRYASLGPTIYFPHGNATLRYLPVWTQGQVGASSWVADVAIGEPGTTVYGFNAQIGVEPAYAASDPTLASRLQSRALVFGTSVRHWVTPRFGYTVGLEYGTERDRATGVRSYSRTALNIGFFIGVGHAKIAP